MSEWDEAKTPIAIGDLKVWVKEMRMAYEIYEDASELKKDAHAKYKEKETRVLKALEYSGLKNINIPGLGTASVRSQFKVTTPKDLEAKREFFNYVAEAHGIDFLDTFRNVNSKSLNKFVNEEISAALENGVDLKIPGLDDATEYLSINFRKETK